MSSLSDNQQLSKSRSSTTNESKITMKKLIEKGKAYIADSDCPDKVCTKMHGVDQNGGGAVCLPNRVVLEPAKHSDGIDYIIG